MGTFLLPMVALLFADWTMFTRDVRHNSFNADESAVTPVSISRLVKAWNLPNDGGLAAAPTLAGGVLYFGDWAGNFQAVSAADGSVLWRQQVGMSGQPEEPACSPVLGVTSQAAVTSDTVYVGGGDASVYALDRATGAIRWSAPLGNKDLGNYIWSSVTFYNGSLYVGLASLADCPLVRGALVRIDPNAPEKRIVRYLAPSTDLGAGVWSTPAIDADTNTVYVTTGTGDQDASRGLFGGTLLALDADTLEIKRWFFLPTNSTEEDIEWGSSPTLFETADGRKLVGATGKDGVLYALSRDTLELQWTRKLAVQCICPECGCGSLSTPAYDGKTLYVGAGVDDPDGFGTGSLYAVDPGSGEVIWQQTLDGTVIAPVTVTPAVVVVSTLNGLKIFDISTGEVLWTDSGGGIIYSQPVVADGVIYVNYLRNGTVALRLAPDGG